METGLKSRPIHQIRKLHIWMGLENILQVYQEGENERRVCLEPTVAEIQSQRVKAQATYAVQRKHPYYAPEVVQVRVVVCWEGRG